MPVDRARLKFRLFDRQRTRLKLGNVKLKFFEKKTGDPVLLAEIAGGWVPEEERIRGQIETLFKISVANQTALTTSVTNRVTRLEWGNNYCGVDSIDPPRGEPWVWTFFTKEIKTGAIK